MPLTGASGSLPKVVVDWAAKLAGVWLYESRGLPDDSATGNKLSAVKRQVEEQIGMYLSGQRRLDAAVSQGDAPSAPVVTT